MAQTKTTSEKKPRFHIQLISVLLTFLGICFLVGIIVLTTLNRFRYNEVVSNAQYYLDAENYLHDLREVSDFLTSNARSSVELQRLTYITSYYDEADTAKRHQIAYDNLMKMVEDNLLYERLLESYSLKNASVQTRDLYAMALVAKANSITANSLPKRVAEFSLSEEDLSLSAKDMVSLARKQITSEGYVAMKNSMNNDLSTLEALLGEQKEATLSRSMASFVTVSHLQIILVIFMAVDIVALCVLLIGFMLLPIHNSIVAMRDNQKIPHCMTYEIDYMITEYNQLYDKHASEKAGLRNRAEHDALTGLYNRAAFDSICDYLSRSSISVAMLLIDLDDFKNVNDIYGHEMGDRALKTIAAALSDYFRNTDYIIRYGGDEFVVLMEDVSKEQRISIFQKIEEINTHLAKIASKEFPKLSISVGVAFSENGYHAELFERADNALYKVKANGKGSYAYE